MTNFDKRDIVHIYNISYLDRQRNQSIPSITQERHPAIVFGKLQLEGVEHLLVGKMQSYSSFKEAMNTEIIKGTAVKVRGKFNDQREERPLIEQEGTLRDSYLFSGEVYLVRTNDQVERIPTRSDSSVKITEEGFLKSNLVVSEKNKSLMNIPAVDYILKENVEDSINALNTVNTLDFNKILSSNVLESTQFIDNAIYINRDILNQFVDYNLYQIVLKEYPKCIHKIKEFILENEHLIDTQYPQGYLKEINEQYQNNELINDDYISNLVENKSIEQMSSVRNYLRESGIDNNIIEKYEIGFCLDETQNLLSDKLTIPIRNESNPIIGFGGISIDESNNIEIVYTNKLDDPAFNINKQLYNVNNISSNEPVNIVDNPLDVILCDKNGLSNTVATLGAKSPEELTKLLEQNDIKDVNIIVNEQNCNYNYLNEIALHLEDKDINLEVSFYQGDTLSDYLINHEVDELVTENINEIREDKLINQNNPSISPDLSESEVNELLTDNIKEYVNEAIMPKVERLSESGLNVDEIYANLHCINPLTEPLGQEYLNNVLELTEYSNTFNKNNINSVFKREIENNIQEQGLNINNDRHMMQMEMSPDLDIS